MADKNITNEVLAERITAVDKRVDRRLTAMNTSINRRFREFSDKLQPFHDYIQQQAGYERGLKENRGSGMKVTPDIVKIILVLATVIAALVGAAKVQ